MRPRVLLLVAARELSTALRTRWFLVAAASFLALSLALSLLGLAGTQRAGMAGFDRTTASLLNLCLLFVPLLTLSLGGLSIAGELEDGSLALLLAQPIGRDEAFVGKFAGLLGAIWLAVLGGFGATGVLVGIYAGGDARAYLALVALMLLYAAATLAIGAFLSVALRGRARVIGAAFAVWLFLVYLSDLGTIGLAVARSLAPGQVLALAMLNPVEQARLLGTLALTQRLEVLGPAGILALESFGIAGAAALLACALFLSAAAALVAGGVLFRKAVVT